MKRFLSDNSRTIGKFVKTHMVMSIMGIMVGLAVLVIEKDDQGFSPIAIIGGLFTVGFMCFLHYDDMYFAGVKEGIRLRAEGEKIDLLKGFKISLVGYAPAIIAGIIAIVIDLVTGTGSTPSVVSLGIFYLFQGSFLSLYMIRVYLGVIGYVIITLIPALIASALGYALGLQDKTLRGLMGMKVKPPYDGPMERKPKNKNQE